MVEPISVAGTVVSLAQLAEQLLGEPTWKKKLAENVRDLVRERHGFNISKGALERWLGSKEAMDLLAPRDRAAIDAIADAVLEPVIRSSRKGRRLSMDDAAERASVVAKRLYYQFLSAMDPSYSAAVLDMKLDALSDRLPQSEPTDLSAIPPSCWTSLVSLRTLHPETELKLRLLLVEHQSTPTRIAEIALSGSSPAWLTNAPHQAWTSLGDFLTAHELLADGAECFEIASKTSPEAALLIGRAALNLAESDPNKAQALAQEASQLGGPYQKLVMAVTYTLANDHEQVLELTEDPLELDAGEETRLFATALRLRALVLSNHLSDAAQLAKEASARHPDRGTLRLRYAECLVSEVDSLPVGSSDRDRMLAGVAEELLEGKRLIDEWCGPTVDVVVQLCNIYLALGDLASVLRVGLSPPQGTARPEEAAAQPIRAAVTLVLITRGDFQQAKEVAGQGATAFLRAYIEAAESEARGDAEAEQGFRQALTSAESRQETSIALLALAQRGKTDPNHLEQIREVDPEWAELIEATTAMANGDHAEAIRITSTWQSQSGPHAVLMSEALEADGDIQGAIATLMDAAENLRSAAVAGFAAEALLRAGREDEAEAVILNALLSYPTDRPARWGLRRRLLEIMEARGDWSVYRGHAKALVEEFPDEPIAKWAVIYSLYRRARFKEAWRLMGDYATPEPVDEFTGIIDVELRARFDPSPDVVRRAFDLAREYSDNEAVIGLALRTASLRGSEGQPLPKELAEESQQLYKTFFERFPNSDLIQAIPIPEQDPLEYLRPYLIGRAETQHLITTDVQRGAMPVGVGMQVAGYSYSSWFLQYGAGPIFANSVDPTTMAIEEEQAGAAVGRAVSVDTSSAATALLAEGNWWQGEYLTGQVADVLVDDAHRGVDEAESVGRELWSWDLQRGGVSRVELSQQQLDVSITTARSLADLMEQLQVVNTTNMAPISQDMEPGLGEPWMASLRLAASRRIPLYADDIALRNLARSAGLSTFGTMSLLNVLIARGTLTADEHENRLRGLMRAYVVDIPLDEDRMIELSVENRFVGGPTLIALSRPAAWLEANVALGIYRKIVAAIVERDMPESTLADWLTAISRGAGSAALPNRQGDVLGLVLASTILNAGIKPSLSRGLVKASRSSARQLGLTDLGIDPLVKAVPILRTFFEGVVSATQAGQWVISVFDQLEPEDHRIVIGALLGGESPDFLLTP